MPRHVLIHPGFHKTGTSTLQRNLLAQGERLEPRLRMMFNDDMTEATQLARKYSAHPHDPILDEFSDAIAAAFAVVDPQDDRPLIVSSEALIGHLPGRKHVTGYDAAPPLIERAVRALRAQIGDDVPVTVWFTTRNAAAWKKSAYYQNLRQERLCETFDEHAQKLERAAQLDQFVDRTRALIGSAANVASTRIEGCTEHVLGPLGMALDILDVYTKDLEPVRAHNVQPPDGAAELLRLNLSDLSDEELAIAKRDLMRGFRQRGETNAT